MPELDKVINGLKACLKYPDKCAGDCTTDLCAYRGGDCHTNLLNDALALLETLRPRVLTLEELISIGKSWNSNTAPYLWSEILNTPEWYTDNLMWVPYNFIHDTISIGSEDYNKHNYMKRWRCWNIKPTDEQRKAVKWDEWDA